MLSPPCFTQQVPSAAPSTSWASPWRPCEWPPWGPGPAPEAGRTSPGGIGAGKMGGKPMENIGTCVET